MPVSFRALWTALVLFLAPAAEAADAWRDTTLANGLRVIAGARHGSGLLSSNVFVRAGAARESEELNGAAHFLEHLLFNGTTTRSQEELYEAVDLLGAYNNATTRTDYALFMMLAGADDARSALDIQADMLFRSTLPPEKFEKERGIVLEEIAKDLSSPDYRAGLLIDELLYEGTPLSRPVLGTESSIRSLSRDRVESYYRALYVPNNMTLLLIGDLDPDEAIAIASETFDAPAGSVEPLLPFRSLFEQRHETGRLVVRPFDDESRRIVIRVDAPLPSDRDFAAAEVLVDVFAGSEGARLRRALDADPAVPVHDATAGVTVVGGRSFFEVRLRTPGEVDPMAAVRRVSAELRRFADEDVSATELAIAKTRRRTEEALLGDQIHYFAMMRGNLVTHVEPGRFDDALGRTAAVTREDVRQLAERRLQNPRPIVVAVGPGLDARDEMIEAGDVGFESPPMELATLDVDLAPPVPNGGAPKATETSPPRVVTLSSGLRVVLRSDPSSEVLAMHLAALGRSYREPLDLPGVADFLHRLLPEGAGRYTKTDLEARLGGIGAALKVHDSPFIPYDDYYTQPEYSYLRLETLDDYHSEAFELLAAMVTSPHLAPESIESVRREMVDVAKRSAASPRGLASEHLRAILHGDPLRMNGTESSIGSITRERLFDFHRLYFAPTNLILGVVTSLPESVVIEELERAFPKERWPYHAGPLRPWDPSVTRPRVDGKPSVRHLHAGEAQSWVTLGSVFEARERDLPALSVAAMVLSDRVAQELREEEGLAYSVGAWFEEWGDVAFLGASMGTRPENVERAVDGLANAIDTMRRADVTEREVIAVAKSSAGRVRMRRITRIGQAYRLTMSVLHGDPLDADERHLAAIEKVTPDAVRRVAKRYFSSAKAHRVVVE